LVDCHLIEDMCYSLPFSLYSILLFIYLSNWLLQLSCCDNDCDCNCHSNCRIMHNVRLIVINVLDSAAIFLTSML